MNIFFYKYGFSILLLFTAAFFLFTGIKIRFKKIKTLLFCFASVFGALLMFEVYAFITDLHNENGVSLTGTYVKNSLITGPSKHLGYGPATDTNFQVTYTKKKNDTLIFDVIYSIKNGIRYTPDVMENDSSFAIFTGCSHVFGDGLNDQQTLPYFFNQLTNCKYNVLNYGFNGYGPHQVLKIVEEYILKNKKILDSKSCVMFYTFIPSHFIRTAGKVPWDKKGPWYEVENNKLVYKGSFEDKFKEENFITLRWNILWKNSNLYKSFFSPKTTGNDIERTLKIMEEIDSKLKQKACRFYVLVTGSKTEEESVITFVKGLQDLKINYFLLDSIIPDLKANPYLYEIKGDGHPNEYFNKKLAKFLSENCDK